MPKIFDCDGNELADIPLSEKQCALLEAGENVVTIYHTPQMLRHVLGQCNGTFTLTKQQDRIVVNDVPSLRAYADMQRAVKQAREHP